MPPVPCRTLGWLPCPATTARHRSQVPRGPHRAPPFRRRHLLSLEKPTAATNLEDRAPAHDLPHWSYDTPLTAILSRRSFPEFSCPSGRHVRGAGDRRGQKSDSTLSHAP